MGKSTPVVLCVAVVVFLFCVSILQPGKTADPETESPEWAPPPEEPPEPPPPTTIPEQPPRGDEQQQQQQRQQQQQQQQEEEGVDGKKEEEDGDGDEDEGEEWEETHTSEELQTRKFPDDDFTKEQRTSSHEFLKQLKFPDRSQYPRGSDISDRQMYKNFRREKGLRSIIRRFEDIQAARLTGDVLTLMVTGGTRNLPKEGGKCTMRTRMVNDPKHKKPIPGPLRSEEELQGHKLCVTRRMLSGEYTPSTFSEFMDVQKLPMHSADMNRKRFGYPMYPYFDGYGMKQMADFQYETDNWLFGNQRPDFEGWVKHRFFNRSLVYWHLEGRDLSALKRLIVRIPGHFFLLTGSLDEPHFPPWLVENPKVLRIFSVNVPVEFQDHPKISVVPLGIRFTLAEEVNMQRFNTSICSNCEPKDLLFASFTIASRGQSGTYVNKRTHRRTTMMETLNKVWNFSSSAAHIKHSLEQYTYMCLRHKFILSPPGLGLDAYRTWQMFYLGRPTVSKALLPQQLYDNLPVVTVPNWSDLTPSVLEEAWPKLQKGKYNLEKMWYPWWVKQILREALAVQ